MLRCPLPRVRRPGLWTPSGQTRASGAPPTQRRVEALDQNPRANPPARFVRDRLRACEVALASPCATARPRFRTPAAASLLSVSGAATAVRDGDTKPDAAPSYPASSRSCEPSPREASSCCRSDMSEPVGPDVTTRPSLPAPSRSDARAGRTRDAPRTVRTNFVGARTSRTHELRALTNFAG